MSFNWAAIEVNRSAVHAHIENHPLGGPVLRLAIDGATCEVALQGAQVLNWQPKSHAPAIWMSPMERLASPPRNPKPVRGGTPICWPWFANHPIDATKPAHGFIRTRLWAVDGVEQAGNSVRARLSTATTEADKALWPHAAMVQFTVTLGETLKLELNTRNSGPDAFALTQALHTYFAVGDIADVTVEGFTGLGYVDKLDGNARKQQTGDIAFSGEVDRIYDGHAGAAAIVDSGLKRRIEITKTGSTSSVVWNPWIDKSARMGDMGPAGYRRMVCVETCNAGQDIVPIEPGAEHTLTAEYRVRAL